MSLLLTAGSPAPSTMHGPSEGLHRYLSNGKRTKSLTSGMPMEGQRAVLGPQQKLPTHPILSDQTTSMVAWRGVHMQTWALCVLVSRQQQSRLPQCRGSTQPAAPQQLPPRYGCEVGGYTSLRSFCFINCKNAGRQELSCWQ